MPHETVARETWRPIDGHPGYEVSDHGNVRSPSGRLIGRASHTRGYVRVGLPVRIQPGLTAQRQVFVHQLVAAAFIGPANGRRVRHIDTSDPTNNHVSNLRYGL